MAHSEMQEYLKRIKARYPDHFRRVRVIDCGSLDINGSNAGLWNLESGYTGIDLMPGKNVNVVMAAEDADWPDGHFHCIISTEMLEHAANWKSAIQNMVRMLRSGGLLILTCATTGREEHGTLEHKPEDSPITTVYYLNLTESDIREVLDPDDFSCMEFKTNDASHDLYFHALKKGFLIHGCTCDNIETFNPEQQEAWVLSRLK